MKRLSALFAKEDKELRRGEIQAASSIVKGGQWFAHESKHEKPSLSKFLQKSFCTKPTTLYLASNNWPLSPSPFLCPICIYTAAERAQPPVGKHRRVPLRQLLLWQPLQSLSENTITYFAPKPAFRFKMS